MTVRELIEHLQTLEQDVQIWVCYDGGYSWFPPTPDEIAQNPRNDGKVKIGDYIINAG